MIVTVKPFHLLQVSIKQKSKSLSDKLLFFFFFFFFFFFYIKKIIKKINLNYILIIKLIAFIINFSSSYFFFFFFFFSIIIIIIKINRLMSSHSQIHFFNVTIKICNHTFNGDSSKI